ncbi:hypothetical protein [Capnocytophaga sp. oral taxon 878]|uniref:hypothetical protein n=1 Tax=Capnocytophaga sp. oral taxon 878 TaxID=1316596 RepID=UPI000D038C69|nr:hypothetical protein [Capnocytophaga sp. oral taxon 878]AVM49089.1 hypothetical protein C4H12_00605 [Capnocytophaga sp. oral taxon 878]
MKKIILSLVAVFAFGAASAQDLVSSKGEQYLPKQGDWSIGFNVGNALTYLGQAFNGSATNSGNNLFNANANLLDLSQGVISSTNSINFVGKKFDTDNKATRYIASFNLNIASSKVGDAPSASTTGFGLTAGYGKEWRKGTTRLQGYYGADALVGFSIPAEKQFGFGVGAQGFAGVEYFIFPKVALGAQYTYGVALTYVNNSATKASRFGFDLGGVGILSATLNAYF